jgi:hypothetical protein
MLIKCDSNDTVVRTPELEESKLSDGSPHFVSTMFLILQSSISGSTYSACAFVYDASITLIYFGVKLFS